MPEVPNFKNYVRSFALGGDPNDDAIKEGMPPVKLWCDPFRIGQESMCNFTGSGLTTAEVADMQPQLMARAEELQNDPTFTENVVQKVVEEFVEPNDFGFDVLFIYLYDNIAALRVAVSSLQNPGTIDV